MGVVGILDRILPFFSIIPPILKYLVIPFSLTQFLMKKKLDGKAPQKFFLDYTIYLFSRTRNIEFFRTTEREAKNVIKLDWRCTCRNF
jgi:hypothetical protein